MDGKTTNRQKPIENHISRQTNTFLLNFLKKKIFSIFQKRNMIREKKTYQETSDGVRAVMDETEQFHVKKIDRCFTQQLI